MKTFVVWLDIDGKWHYSCISGYFPSDKGHDAAASRVVKADAQPAEYPRARASFAVHAWTPSQAIKTAKEYYKQRLLGEGKK